MPDGGRRRAPVEIPSRSVAPVSRHSPFVACLVPSILHRWTLQAREASGGDHPHGRVGVIRAGAGRGIRARCRPGPAPASGLDPTPEPTAKIGSYFARPGLPLADLAWTGAGAGLVPLVGAFAGGFAGEGALAGAGAVRAAGLAGALGFGLVEGADFATGVGFAVGVGFAEALAAGAGAGLAAGRADALAEGPGFDFDEGPDVDAA